MVRYAISVTPDPATSLWSLGCAILGYDAATGLDAPFPDHPAYHDPLSLAWSAEPRAFGFQGTLKAPFELAAHATATTLAEEMRVFASNRAPFELDLKLSVVGRAFALVPSEPSAALQALADDCVRHFDLFRRPLSPADRERQHPDDLIERQVENLDTWGSPFVFESFDFHLTLTGALAADDRRRVEPTLQAILAEKAPLRLVVDSLTLLVQQDPLARYVVAHRFAFAAG